MKILSLFLAICLIVYGSLIHTFAAESTEENVAFLTYEYDASKCLVILTLSYSGEGILAIGATVEYDSEILDYTSYEVARDLGKFQVIATLENCGKINILACGSENFNSGDIIRICFKVKGDFDRLEFALVPLTSISAAGLSGERIVPINVNFVGLNFENIKIKRSMKFCERTDDGGLAFGVDGVLESCYFDVTVVELSGNIRRFESMLLSDAAEEFSRFFLDVGDLGSGYAAVIINPYYFENEQKIFIEQGIFLFFNGKYID